MAWSSLYLAFAAYVAATLRSRAEILFYAAALGATFFVAIFCRPEIDLYTRVSGSIIGIGLLWMMHEGRRLILVLQEANRDLETKVAARTRELQASQLRLEDLSRNPIAAQENERSHIARELHDELGQILTALKMNLRRIQRPGATNANSILEDNVTMIDTAIERVRNLALNLRPPQLDELGVVAALHWLIKQQARVSGFKGDLTVSPPDLQVRPELEIVCFRIAQEAVTNAVRHAAPTIIEVELRQDAQQLHLIIRDNGSGFHAVDARRISADIGRFGLLSMRKRALLVGGTFEIPSNKGTRTTVDARFPV